VTATVMAETGRSGPTPPVARQIGDRAGKPIARGAGEANRRLRDRIAASRVALSGGWTLGLDSPPGVGWVLRGPPDHPPRYYATKELALARYRELTGRAGAP
jgi:hypothetical protein